MDKWTSWKKSLDKMRDVELAWKVPMARCTTFRVGGEVTCLARPQSEQALIKLLQLARQQEMPHVLLGCASNVLLPDNPWDVLVIQNKDFLLDEDVKDINGRVLLKAGAGVKLSRCLRFCLEKGLFGLECLTGIPGTVGGAVVMNAGTKSGTIADSLVWVEVLESSGVRRRVERAELSPGYRSMGLPCEGVIVKACLELRPGSKQQLRSNMAKLMRQRKENQPLHWPSAGSVFKNPAGKSAGRLIEQAGLKGFSIGDAQVSEVHANWIINRGHASAAQILAVMKTVEDRVFDRFGIRLEREIQVMRQ